MRGKISTLGTCLLVTLSFIVVIVEIAPPVKAEATYVDIKFPLLAIPTIKEKGDYFIIHVDSDANASSNWNISASTSYDNFTLTVNSAEEPVSGKWLLNVSIPSDVREDLYDITITVDGDSDSEANALSVVESFSNQFKFIQITDTHLGYSAWLGNSNAERNYKRMIEEINLIHPTFVIVTGDNVNRDPRDFWSTDDEQYKMFRDGLLDLTIPVFVIPGNHDYGYRGDYTLDKYNESLGPYEDYSFDYGRYHFIGMDSGKWSSYFSTNTEGLTDGQITWLQNDLDANTDAIQTFVYFHATAYDTDEDDNSTSISNNRQAFIDVCKNYNLTMHLAGHTHRDEVYDRNGEKQTGDIKNPDFPLFIQTGSTCKGDSDDLRYRLIRVNGSGINTYTYDKNEPYGVRDADSAIPLGNLDIDFLPFANDGTEKTVTATITNDLRDYFNNAFLMFKMSKPDLGYNYTVNNGWIDQKIELPTMDIYYVRTNISEQEIKNVTMKQVYMHDVGVKSIDSYVDGGIYGQGEQDILSTIENYALNVTNFNTSLEIRKVTGLENVKTVFSDDNEAYVGRGNWTLVESTTRTIGDWEHGNPTSGPEKAHSGNYSWSTEIDGNYGNFSHYEFAGTIYDYGGFPYDIYGKNEFYDVPAQEGDYINITVTWASGSGNDINLYLYDPHDILNHNIDVGDKPSGGYAVAWARSGVDGIETLTYTVPQKNGNDTGSGIYQVRVFAYGTGGNQYDFTISVFVDGVSINYPYKLGTIDHDDDDLPNEQYHTFWAWAGDIIYFHYNYTRIDNSSPNVDFYLKDPYDVTIFLNTGGSGDYINAVGAADSGYYTIIMDSEDGTQKYNCWVNVTSAQFAYLISPVINMSNKSYENAKLSFWQWYEVEDSWDYCYVYVLYNGSTRWQELAKYTGESGGWEYVELSLNDAIGYDDVTIQFILGSDWCISYAGWYIDDINITMSIPPPSSIVYLSNLTVNTLNESEVKSLSWLYDFQDEGQYIIILRTWLSDDGDITNDIRTVTISIVSTFTIPLPTGWNLISAHLIQSNTLFSSVLQSIQGEYNSIQWYDVINTEDHWKHYYNLKPSHLNDLNDINHKIGFWIYITPPGGTILRYNGTQPTQNQTIPLHLGWNMVGYPSLSNHNRTEGLNNLDFDTDVDAIQWYDSYTKSWHFMGPDDVFLPGRGYWVHSKVEITWEVPI